MRSPLELEAARARFMERVEVQENGCWHTTDRLFEGENTARAAWRLFVGGIPDGKAVRRHPMKCPTKPYKGYDRKERIANGDVFPQCVNPAHRRLITLTDAQAAHIAKVKEWARIDREERERLGLKY